MCIMKKKICFLKALFIPFMLFLNSLHAQIIETDPLYPTINDSVDVIFHSNRCECGLADYTGDIYAHTGILTDQSAGPSNWYFVIADWNVNLEKAKLEKINDSTYILHITPDINSYYNLTPGTNVEKLAFVFRTPSGSMKTADLFADVYEPGLSLAITHPTEDACIKLDSTIAITVEPIALGTGAPDSMILYVDGMQEYVSFTSPLEYDYTGSAPGEHWIKIVADNGEFRVADSLFVFVHNPVTVADLPSGVRDGVNSINDTTVTMVIYAPNKDCILVIGDFNDWRLSNEYLMNQTPDNDRFWLTFSGLTPDDEYAFQYLIDGNLRIADPYTEKILDPVNDPYIPESTYPNLKPYPNNKTSGIVSTFMTVQDEYTWQTGEFTPAAHTDLVIYELHVQNFTEEGNLKALTDTLDYMFHLGINAIELMPVNEFEGNLSWGYNPSFYFALDKMYGTKNDLKAFVDACHARGIAVIIDLVLNHSYGQSPLVQMYWDPVAQKPAADNPWYNVNSNFVDNTSAQWGYDFNHESQATQKLVDSINAYWMSEYRIDGYRFDFTKGFSNTLWYGSDNWAGSYDADRIAILERMTEQIWLRNNDALVIFEHLSENTEEKELAEYGIMLWGNMNYEYNEATMGYSSNFYNVSYLNRGWTVPNLVSYMESHDEERLMYKNLRWGNSSENYNVKNFAFAMQRMEAAAAFFLTVPGPKMIFQWGELGYNYSINTCADGTVDDNGGCRLALKPVAWEEGFYEDPHRYRLNKFFEALIKLRIEEDLFETTDFTLSTSNALKKMHLNSASLNAAILGNFGITPGTLDPAFQHTGTWYNYITGESFEVNDAHASIELGPGDYRIYFDQAMEVPDLPVSLENSFDGFQDKIVIYPNPTRGQITIENKDQKAFILELYSLTGERILQTEFDGMSGQYQLDLTRASFQLPANGVYIYRIIRDDQSWPDILILKK